MKLTEDIKPEWLCIIRRLQSAAVRQRGYAIVNINVVIDSHGKPMFWSGPKITEVEPADRASKFLAQVIAGFNN